MKRLLALLLICLMIPASIVADTEGFHPEGFPIMDEEIKVTCLFPRSASQPTDFSDMWLVRRFRDLMNIDVEYDLVEKSAFNERKALVLASGDYPDIFFGGITAEDEIMYGGQGIFVDLSEMIEKYAPNFTALMEEYPDIRASITTEDGKIYSMPVIYTAARDRIAATGWINTGWLKRVGKEMPTTLDELYEVLCAFRDEDANGNGDPKDEIPVTYRNDLAQDFKRSVLAALGICGDEDDVIAGEYVYVPMTEQYKEYLRYMAKLYKENLLDHDAFILSPEEYYNLLKEDRVGVGDSTWPSYYWVSGDYAENWDKIPMLTSGTYNQKSGRRSSSFSGIQATLS